MEALAPVLVDDAARWWCTSCRPARTSCSATRSGSARGPPTWCARRRSSSTRPGRRPPAADRRRSTSALRRCASSATCGTRPAAAACRGGASPRCTRPTPTVASAFSGRADLPRRHRCRAGRSPPLGARGLAHVLVFDGHGPAQRAVERLRAADAAGPATVDDADTRAGRGRRDHRARCRPASSRPSCKLAVPDRGRPHRPARVADPRREPDAVAPAQRHRPDPAASPGTTSCTSSTASAGTCEMVRRTVNGGEREYLIIEYAPVAGAGSPATGSSSRPTRWTR